MVEMPFLFLFKRKFYIKILGDINNEVYTFVTKCLHKDLHFRYIHILIYSLKNSKVYAKV